ncbi:MAG: His/Gly/Thr/Pro-type tRNA ligase C-terminal domain-containing protein, partial [Devosiaceae bacterium]
GGDLSHEFIILADTGESEVFCDSAMLDLPIPGEDTDFSGDLADLVTPFTTPYAATDEMHDASAFEGEVPAERRVSARGIEVGHIFYFGTKYSEPMGAVVTGPDGKDVPVHMGSYGIGPSRLVPAIIEASHDENGIIWPASVAPFDVGIINMRVGDTDCDNTCATLEARLSAIGLDVLYDDSDARGGAKFAQMDLIGLPKQIIVGPKGLKDGQVELKDRKTGERTMLSPDDVAGALTPT